MSDYINEFLSDLPTHPGETLLETLELKGMTQAELAQRMGRPRKTVNEIIKGKTAITPETALQLELVLDIPASFWNKRERDYQEAVARIEQQTKLSEWLPWIENIPYKEMIKLGWLPQETEPQKIFKSILSYFGVVSPDQWDVFWGEKLDIAFRRSTAYSTDAFEVATWLRRGEILGQELECDVYSESKFKETLEEIRELTAQIPSATLYQDTLVDLCRRSGVAVVIVPRLKKVRAFGASQWLSPRKALIIISLYYKRDDIFWYTFFHEAAHLLFHSKKEVFINLDEGEQYTESEIEDQANEYARNYLIPIEDLQRFIRSIPRTGQGELYFDDEDICNFAKQLRIAPSIVVGRLQYDGMLKPQYRNHFKTTFIWSKKQRLEIKQTAQTCI